MGPDEHSGLRAGRLDAARYARHFADAYPPLTPVQALIEAERCYSCFDAPCTAACPTGIDVPAFIQRIAQGNLRGAARTILEANPLGGMCARVCPTEVLCEQACVRHTNEDKPVEIGALQRHATDALMARPGAPLFTRAPATGRRVAVVGAGPAGLACAHGLARRGHAVVLFDAKPRLGGLNEYGIARYKTVDDFAQREVTWLLSIGGIEVRPNTVLGRDVTIEQLLAGHDAVFLGLGLAGVQALGLPEPALEGVRNAVDFIAELRQSPPAAVKVGRRVVVIGGGMTAVDAAVQARLLGAQQVTMVYRRGPESMPASLHEQHFAQARGVAIRHWARPAGILNDGSRVLGLACRGTRLRDGRLEDTDETFVIEADQVLKAIGQAFEPSPIDVTMVVRDGRLAGEADGRTLHPGVWIGGDCKAGGRDLTVEAVEDGKRAAAAIHAALTGTAANGA